jgi:uncharacterized protein
MTAKPQPHGSQAVIEKTAEHIRGLLGGDSTGHDWWHVERVRRMALHIARCEGADTFVVELAALLHDVADWKFHEGDQAVGARRAAEWLAGLGVDAATVEHVAGIVRDVSFKGAGGAPPMRSLEGQAVQDADRLDAMGAIGIARAFAYGAHAGQPIYDPRARHEHHETFAAYQRGSRSTINHFHEKLLLLKDRLHTATARRMAEERHAFMLAFLQQFHAEWSGDG